MTPFLALAWAVDDEAHGIAGLALTNSALQVFEALRVEYPTLSAIKTIVIEEDRIRALNLEANALWDSIPNGALISVNGAPVNKYDEVLRLRRQATDALNTLPARKVKIAEEQGAVLVIGSRNETWTTYVSFKTRIADIEKASPIYYSRHPVTHFIVATLNLFCLAPGIFGGAF